MKRKSKELKKIQGTDRGDRDRGVVLKFEGDIPDPVIKLRKVAKDWYYVICDHLIEVDGFLSPDALTVAQFCKALDLYIQVANRLKTGSDCIQTFKNGASNISGDFTSFSKLSTMLRELGPQIGIGIKSRQNVSQFVSNQLTLNLGGNDEWQELLTIHKK